MAPAFLVTGAGGQQGGATARYLLKEGATVHALVRDTTSPAAKALENSGAILFKGDFDDVAAIKAATTGVSGVFLNLSPGEKQVQQAHTFIDAAVASKTAKTLVISTAFFTGDRSIWEDEPGVVPYYTSKSAVEEAVRTAGFEHYTILRPAWLMHNYLLPAAIWNVPELATEGILAHVYDPDTRLSHFDADDVGKFAAAALLDPAKFSGHEIELGNENFTVEEAAEHLRKASGVDIKLHLRTPEEAERVAPKVATMTFSRLANRKSLAIDGKVLEKKYGIKLKTFEEYLKEHRDELLKSLPASQ